MKMTVQYLNPPSLSSPTGYSHVTVTGPGRLVHVAGQVAKTVDGRAVGVGLKEKMRSAYREMSELWNGDKGIVDLRTVAYVIALRRIAARYESVGI
jgi:hypothetical protein